MSSWLKILLKRLYSAFYRLFLPLLVYPPGRMHRGEYLNQPRYAIVHLLEDWQPRLRGRVLDVGVGSWTLPRRLLTGQCEYVSTDCYAGENIDVVSDIHHLGAAFPPESFDFVLCTDVFEHLPRPWLAARELCAVLKPGGTLLLTTPFNYRLHGNAAVTDYWRMTADGLRLLLAEEGGFDEVLVQPQGHPAFPFSYVVIAKKRAIEKG